MKTQLMVSGLALALALSGCERGGTHAQKDTDHGNAAATASASEAVMAADEALLAAFRGRDAAAAAAHYAEDATLMIATRPPAVGRAAIQSLIAGDFADPNFTIEFSAAEAEASGDLGYTRGRYTVTFTHPQTRQPGSESGSYLTVFRRQPDGAWLVVEDITTPTAAAQGGQEGAGEGNSTDG